VIKDIKEAKELLADYGRIDESNLDDVLTEIADNETDAYNSDRREWLMKDTRHIEYLEDAISDLGWDGCGKDLDSAIGYAQFRANHDLLEEAWDEMKE
jgi:hypothetical protein